MNEEQMFNWVKQKSMENKMQDIPEDEVQYQIIIKVGYKTPKGRPMHINTIIPKADHLPFSEELLPEICKVMEKELKII